MYGRRKNDQRTTHGTAGHILQRLLLPNGVRLHPRHGDDTGRSGGIVGSDEEGKVIMLWGRMLGGDK